MHPAIFNSRILSAAVLKLALAWAVYKLVSSITQSGMPVIVIQHLQ